MSIRRVTLAALSVLAVTAAPAQAATSTQDIRVSRTATGAQPNSEASTPSTSTTGRYVAYISAASDIVGTVTYDQVFLFDRDTGTTTLVSRAADGTPGNAGSEQAAVSPDGRYVVFASSATNLVDLTIPARQIDNEVYRYNVRTGAVSLISQQGGTALPYLSNLFGLAVSSTGRYVTFNTNHAVLAQDTNKFWDVYRLDALAGTVTLVTRSYSGGSTDQHSYSLAVSTNGNKVLFSSQASNLVSGLTNPRKYGAIYLTNLATGETRLVSAAVDGGIPDDDSYGATVTPDGRRVVFVSQAHDLVTGQSTTTNEGIFVADLRARSLTQVAAGSSPVDVSSPTISDDGRWVAYATNAGTTGATQIVRADLTAGTSTVVAANADAVHDVREPHLSGDGSSVTYVKETAKLTGPNSLPTAEVRQWRVAQ